MRKVSALVIVLIFLLCIPAYGDEIATPYVLPATQDTSDGNQSEAYTATASQAASTGGCRIVLDYPIAFPNDAKGRGLDPVYKVESSYVDDNGVTWYVMGGPKGVVLSENDCSVQKFMDIDTDDPQRKQIIKTALEKLGCRYAYGKSGDQVFDCSGFISYCMKNVGVTVPRSSYSICAIDAKIDKDSLKAGDILATPGHVGLYIGNGCFIHAQDHSNGVVTDYLDIYNANSYKKFRYYIDILD